MKKVVFCSTFFALLLTLVSFTNSKSNSFCDGPPLPTSINVDYSPCDVSVNITYPSGAYVGNVLLHDLVSNTYAWVSNTNFGSNSITIVLPYNKDYRVSLDYPTCSGPRWAYFSTYGYRRCTAPVQTEEF
jgi:hypothetical protein